MGSNEIMQEKLEEKDENNNNNFGPTDEGSNLSSLDNTAQVLELKQIVASKLSDISAGKDIAEVEELKELADSDVKEESLKDDEEMMDVCTNGRSTDHDDSVLNNNNNNTAAIVEEKDIETLSIEFSDICTKELGSTGTDDDSLVNNNNNTAMVQEEIEPFSGVLSDSDVTLVRELIESDPFLRHVVDSFMKYHDELKSDEQNGSVYANGGSTLSDVNHTEMGEEKMM